MQTIDTQSAFENQPKMTFRETMDLLSTFAVNGQPSPALVEERKRFLEILQLSIDNEELELVLEQNPSQFEKTYVTGEYAQTTSFPDFVLRNFIAIADTTRFPDLSERVAPTTPEEENPKVKTVITKEQESTKKRTTLAIEQPKKPHKHKILAKLDTFNLCEEEKEVLETFFKNLIPKLNKAILRFIEKHFEHAIQIILTNGHYAKEKLLSTIESNRELVDKIDSLTPKNIQYKNGMSVEFSTERLIEGVKIDREYYATLLKYSELITQDLIIACLANILGYDTSQVIEYGQELKNKTNTALEKLKEKIASFNTIIVSSTNNLSMLPLNVQKQIQESLKRLRIISNTCKQLIIKFIETGDVTLLEKIAEAKAKFNAISSPSLMSKTSNPSKDHTNS